MKKVLKLKAWDIRMFSNEETILCAHSRTLKVRGILSNDLKASRNVSRDYYVSSFVIETKEMIVAMGTKNNQIDILALKDLTLIESIKWKGPKKFLREKCVIDEEKENVYSILYADGLQKTIVTKFNLRTREEEIFAEFQNRYLFNILYLEKEKTCLIGGIHFFDVAKEGVVGEYEVFLLNNFDERIILKDLAKSTYAHLHKIGRTKNNETLICYSDLKGLIIRNETRNEDVMILSHDSYVAFSKKGDYIAYIDVDKVKLKIYLYSIMSRNVVDEYTVEHSGSGLVKYFRFQVEDKYLTLQENETTYIIKI